MAQTAAIADAPVAPQLTFPDEVADFVRTAYGEAGTILEYGSGGSTVLAAELGKTVLSIESDRRWTRNLNAYLQHAGYPKDQVRVEWVNVGPTKKWGYPTDVAHWKKFPSYPLYPYEQTSFDPDLVLIDGRFRLACLAAVMLHAQRPVTVLFDDYLSRPAYRQAEEFLEVREHVERMAMFEVQPKAFTGPEYSKLLRWFFRIR